MRYQDMSSSMKHLFLLFFVMESSSGSSCVGRCYTAYDSREVCQCDDICPDYKNCCPDFNICSGDSETTEAEEDTTATSNEQGTTAEMTSTTNGDREITQDGKKTNSHQQETTEEISSTANGDRETTENDSTTNSHQQGRTDEMPSTTNGEGGTTEGDTTTILKQRTGEMASSTYATSSDISEDPGATVLHTTTVFLQTSTDISQYDVTRSVIQQITFFVPRYRPLSPTIRCQKRTNSVSNTFDLKPLTKRLKLYRNSTNAYKRRHTSAEESRKSSMMIGSASTAVIIIIFFCFVVTDLGHIKTFRK